MVGWLVVMNFQSHGFYTILFNNINIDGSSWLNRPINDTRSFRIISVITHLSNKKFTAFDLVQNFSFVQNAPSKRHKKNILSFQALSIISVI